MLLPWLSGPESNDFFNRPQTPPSKGSPRRATTDSSAGTGRQPRAANRQRRTHPHRGRASQSCPFCRGSFVAAAPLPYCPLNPGPRRSCGISVLLGGSLGRS
jgi:hypothetical protein